jgi:murein DD-endopeptidase MepM/ murein hydrolase activator NlpD/uncharacterized protein YgiM (DUF1202 family)
MRPLAERSRYFVRKVTISAALALILILGPVPTLLSLSPVGSAPPPASPGYAPEATDFIYPVGDPRVAPTTADDSPNGYQIEEAFNNSCDPSLQQGLSSGGTYFCGHTGVDLFNKGSADDMVHATANGLVAEAGYVGAMGEMVRLQHLLPDGTYIYSLYQHMAMDSLRVTRGDVVTMGQPLGRVGDTGFAIGAHLHFAITTVNQDGVGYTFGDSMLLATYRDPLAYVAAHTASGPAVGGPTTAATTPVSSPTMTAPTATAVVSPSVEATATVSPSVDVSLSSSSTITGVPASTSTAIPSALVGARATAGPTITPSVAPGSSSAVRGIRAAFDRRYRAYVTVTTAHVNVRSGSGYQFAPLTSVVKGARLGYLGVSGDGWVQVVLPDDVVGYIARQYVEGAGLPALPPLALAPTPGSRYVVVTDTRYPARNGPLMRDMALEPLWVGEKLPYLRRDSYSPSWDQVLLPSGRVGWILNWYLHGPSGGLAARASTPQGGVRTAHPAPAGSVVITTVDHLNLRQGPRLGAAAIERLALGTRLRLRGYHVSWAAVVAPDGTDGYVLGRYVRRSSDVRTHVATRTGAPRRPGTASTQTSPATTAASVIVSVPAANLRAAPSLRAPVILSVVRDTLLTPRAIQGDWLRVRTGTGVIAWIMRTLTRPRA